MPLTHTSTTTVASQSAVVNAVELVGNEKDASLISDAVVERLQLLLLMFRAISNRALSYYTPNIQVRLFKLTSFRPPTLYVEAYGKARVPPASAPGNSIASPSLAPPPGPHHFCPGKVAAVAMSWTTDNR